MAEAELTYLAEVELLGENLLNVLGPLHAEAAVRHHKVDAAAAAVLQHKPLQLVYVVGAEDVAVALDAVNAVVGLEALGRPRVEVLQLEVVFPVLQGEPVTLGMIDRSILR